MRVSGLMKRYIASGTRLSSLLLSFASRREASYQAHDAYATAKIMLAARSCDLVAMPPTRAGIVPVDGTAAPDMLAPEAGS